MIGEKDYNVLLGEFVIWATDNDYLTVASASSYKSYIRRAISSLEDKYISDLSFDLVVNSNNENYANFDIVDSFLTEIFINSDRNAKKTSRDNRSGFRLFNIFLVENDYRFKFKQISEKPNLKIEYTNKELLRKFRSSLNTQDRVSDDIIIYFRLINKILNASLSKKEYNNFIGSEIGKIKFIISSLGESIPFSVVESLEIDETGKVSILTKGGRFDVYSKYKDKYELLKVTGAAQISLDHIVPLSRIIIDFINKDSIFFDLSRQIEEYLFLNNLISDNTARELRRVLINKKPRGINQKLYDSLGKNIDSHALLEDLFRLYEFIELEVMHRNHNSSKNNN